MCNCLRCGFLPICQQRNLFEKGLDRCIQWSEIPTRKVKPSQTCACCGVSEKKDLSMRVHHCLSCGFKADRDVNLALVMINYALTGIAHSGEKVTGQELALGVESGVTWMLKHETPPIPEHAR